MTAQERLTRKQKKALKQEKKKARLLSRPEFQKIPRIQESVGKDEIPRAIENPDSIMQQFMQWDDSKGDIAGIWSWGQQRNWHENNDWQNTIYPNLREFERLTWAQIYGQTTGGNQRHRKHRDMDLNVILPEAIERWVEIGFDDHEKLFRFRLGNYPRLWGFKISSKFFVVWWDKFHKIYPTD